MAIFMPNDPLEVAVGVLAGMAVDVVLRSVAGGNVNKGSEVTVRIGSGVRGEMDVDVGSTLESK